MDKNSLSEITCPKCSANVVIYKGWADFEEEKIRILKGAKWRCPKCGKTGKFDDELSAV